MLLHDLNENVGIYDRLIPKLTHPNGIYVVGLDLAGHEQSHGLPLGSIYLDSTMVSEIGRFVKHLGWHQCYHNFSPRKKVLEKSEQVHDHLGFHPKGKVKPMRDKLIIIGHGGLVRLPKMEERLFRKNFM